MKKSIILTLCLGIAFVIGCAQEKANEPSQPSIDGTKFLLTKEPEGAVDIIEARKTVKDGDDVLVVGRIGGSKNPWIDDLAAFTIADRSLKACNDTHCGKCQTPWDYCCQRHLLPTATAFVKIVDENGLTVKMDARKLLNVKELTTLVIQGKAKRDDSGNLTVLATGVYARK